MIVMKRYCDYDYDNNCIILFDATDAESDDDLNICWISSGDKEEEEPECKQPRDMESAEEKVPLYQYLETEYDKKMMAINPQFVANPQILSSFAANYASVRGSPNVIKNPRTQDSFQSNYVPQYHVNNGGAAIPSNNYYVPRVNSHGADRTNVNYYQSIMRSFSKP